MHHAYYQGTRPHPAKITTTFSRGSRSQGKHSSPMSTAVKDNFSSNRYTSNDKMVPSVDTFKYHGKPASLNSRSS